MSPDWTVGRRDAAAEPPGTDIRRVQAGDMRFTAGPKLPALTTTEIQIYRTT